MAVSLTALTAVLVVACLSVAGAFWQEDLTPRRYIPLDEGSMLKFSGNLSHKDHFRLLEKDGDSLLIGARNIVFNISLSDFTERREERLEWHSEQQDVQLCIMKGLDEEACHNYIRVLAKRGDDELFVCGTNSYKPKCRSYKKKPDLGYVPQGGERDGRGLCPYDPNHNSTVTFVGGQTYAGTVADFASSDPLIYRDQRPLRTDKFELKQLNAPSFVGSMEHGDHVYFFFRETAVEYINCGKRAYSRVARVCKKDRGGSYKYKNKWTSFLKSRLNCSIPGEYPFYFDEIQSISTVQSGVYGGRPEEILYAVFTTPSNSIPGSAICAFRMADIVDTFDGAFKHQQNMNSNWLPLKSSQVPQPRPGLCVNDSRRLSDVHLNFIQSHPLMDAAVPALHGRPLLVSTSLRHRFTKIAVDPQVAAADGTLYDVLFIGTDDGRVLKAVNAASGSASVRAEPVLVEELEVFPSGAAITNLLVSRQPAGPARLVAVTDSEVRALPLYRCGDKAVRCADCVRLQDPYCGWEAAGQRCAPIDSPSWPEGIAVVQNVSHGAHPHCPPVGDREPKILYQEATTPRTTAATTTASAPCDCGADPAGAATRTPNTPRAAHTLEKTVDRVRYSAGERGQKVLDIVEQTKPHHAGQSLESQYSTAAATGGMYTAETLAVAVVTTCLLAVVIGFLAGWLISRRYSRTRSEAYYETPHLDHQSKMNQMETAPPVKPDNRCDQNFLNSEPAFLVNNGKQINLVVNQTKNSNGKNANSAADNKPLQKVRKMYL
ncbi:semaphorin-1A-like isoform X1 [Pollicipes pollicipes]|uniref:semaphorin-1A-like isoform X1 n=1 Tax=Pollicipes pollicipes TaxID=41117 RepID=UPI00188493D9|nr:semaphorin-1A-like isoform X1 [Pollicipes pollicipes]